nr:ribonuclease HII [Candidatus Sigynarchaeota archaeon]
MESIVGGADEAGRGPVFGPLVICCACFYKKDLEGLKASGVTDSKKLSPGRRETLAREIKAKAVDYEVLIMDAVEIDRNVGSGKLGMNLNTLEISGFCKVINALIERKVKMCEIWLDAADVNEERFKTRIEQGLKSVQLCVRAAHKADARFVQVGAASIIAKTTRDGIMAELATEYGNIGSGYPSDPVTKNFLHEYYREHGILPPFTRRSWKTVADLEKELGHRPRGQQKLF